MRHVIFLTNVLHRLVVKNRRWLVGVGCHPTLGLCSSLTGLEFRGEVGWVGRTGGGVFPVRPAAVERPATAEPTGTRRHLYPAPSSFPSRARLHRSLAAPAAFSKKSSAEIQNPKQSKLESHNIPPLWMPGTVSCQIYWRAEAERDKRDKRDATREGMWAGFAPFPKTTNLSEPPPPWQARLLNSKTAKPSEHLRIGRPKKHANWLGSNTELERHWHERQHSLTRPRRPVPVRPQMAFNQEVPYHTSCDQATACAG
jgi:hypothetical protein